MAIQVQGKIELENGKQITHYTSLKIEQDLFRHHQFEILVPFEVLENEDEHFFNQAHENVCGKSIMFSFEPVYQYEDDDNAKTEFSFSFKGVVTEISLRNQGDLANVFVIKGYSPTILLEDMATKRTFLDQNLKNIFDKVLSSYAGNMLKKKIQPRSGSKIKYIVQYNETNFQFLSRLAAEYGEWFYYNGEELLLGRPSEKQENDFLIDGIQSFDMSISLQPSKFQLASYVYKDDKTYNVDAKNKTVQGISQFGKFAMDQSDNLFQQSSAMVAAKPIYSNKELDELVSIKKSVNASNMIVFRGNGEIPNVNIGTVMNVKGAMPEKGGRTKWQDYGKYVVTEITHNVDSSGNYSNNFKAVPDSVQYPPSNPAVKHPLGQTELATVTKNEDPDKLGRVKVAFLWPGSENESDWVRVGSFYSGGGDGMGMFFTPEVGAQVLIDYELNHPEYPFIVTSMYPKKSKSRGVTGKNESKYIYTQAGNQIALIDKQGENKIEITNAGKTDTVIELEFKGNGTVAIKTNGKVEINAQETISLSAGQKISIEAIDIEIKAQNGLKCEGIQVDVKAMTFKMNADATAELKANATMKISSAMTEINGDGITTVKGGILKLN